MLHTAPVTVFLSLVEMPDSLRPCHAERRGSLTLLECDPRHTREEITAGVYDVLGPAERDYVQEAFGLVPGQYLPDWTVEGAALLYVPPRLRLPGAPALQGGAELDRRRADGLLAAEHEACLAELRAETPTWQPVGPDPASRSPARTPGERDQLSIRSA